MGYKVLRKSGWKALALLDILRSHAVIETHLNLRTGRQRGVPVMMVLVARTAVSVRVVSGVTAFRGARIVVVLLSLVSVVDVIMPVLISGPVYQKLVATTAANVDPACVESPGGTKVAASVTVVLP